MSPRQTVSNHQNLGIRRELQLQPSIPVPELVKVAIHRGVVIMTWYVWEARNRFLNRPLRPRPMRGVY